MFFCDPPGHTGIEHLFNLGHDDIVENDFVFFHDQEPIHLDLHQELFQEVTIRNYDIFLQRRQEELLQLPDKEHTIKFDTYRKLYPNDVRKFFEQHPHLLLPVLKLNLEQFQFGHVIVSEKGEYVETLEQTYGWKPHYYFYHGWACQDWFRGYDRAFLIPRAADRTPTRTFMSPNRIIGGRRDHRVLFLYHVYKQALEHNHISAPRICTQENVDIGAVARKYSDLYTDIEQVFNQANLPRLFAGEDTQQMTSCWLSNFTEAQDSLVYVPTETVYFGRRLHITEKTFKAIALEMPFVLVAPAGSLAYLREYGFQTFGDIFDESYDEETDDIKRIERVARLLKDLDNLSLRERQQIHRACLPIVQHNYNHFYRGGLTDILWTELVSMLNELRI